MKSFIPLLATFIIASSFLAKAQESSSYFYFPVQKIEPGPDNKKYLRIKHGADFGIKKNAPVSLWGLYDEQNIHHSQVQLASGVVYSVSDDYSILLVTETDTVYLNDLAAIYLPDPPIDPALLELVKFRIELTNINNEPIYDLKALYSSRNPASEKKILLEMMNDIKQAAKNARAVADDIPIDVGRFTGKTILNLMDSVNERDLRDFIHYTARYPLRYMGKTTRLTTMYTKWLFDYAPLTTDDLYTYFLDAAKSEDIVGFRLTYKDHLDNSTVITWSRDALILAEEGEVGQAKINIRYLEELANQLDNTNVSGWVIYYQGRVNSFTDEPAAVLPFYEKALENFIQSEDSKGQGYALISISDISMGLNQYEESLPVIQKAQNFLSATKLNEPGNSYMQSEYARTFYLLGHAYFQLARYDSSVYYFEQMLTLYTEINDHYNINVALDHLQDAYAYNGECEKAVGIALKKLKRYIEAGNQKEVANTYFAIGYIYNGHCSFYEKAIEYYELAYTANLAVGDTSTAIISRSNVGQSYWSLKVLDLAIKNHEEAIALAIKANNRKQHIFSLSKLADLYKENGNPKKGLAAYDKITALLEEEQEYDQVTETYNKIGEIYKEAKDYTKANEYYEKAISSATKANDYYSLASINFNKADLLFKQEKYDEALKYYEQSLVAADSSDNLYTYVDCLSNIGLLYSFKNDYQTADSLFTKSLALSIPINNKNGVAYTTTKLAESAVRKRDYKKAHEYYNTALKTYEELGDERWQTLILEYISAIYINEGKFKEAEEALFKAKDIATRNNDRTNVASCLFYLADLEGRIYGNFTKAWQYQNEANELYKEIDNTWGIAWAKTNIGNLYNLQGEYVKAINYYQQSDSLYNLLDNPYSRTTPINNIGTIYFWQGDYDKALQQFNTALNILDSIGISDASRTLFITNIGEVYFEQGKYDLANKWLQQGLTETREVNDLNLLSSTLTILGEMALNQEDYDLAKTYLTEAYQIGTEKNIRIGLSITQLNMGKLYYNTKDITNAHKYLDEAIQTSFDISSDRRLWEAYYYKGLIAKEAGQLVESKEALISAIETLERIQSKIAGGAEAKKTFASGEKQVMVYSTLVDVLIELGEVDLALQYLERSNVEALRNKFNQLDIRFGNDTANETLKKERELKMKLDNIEKTISSEKSSGTATAVDKIATLEKSRSIAENEYLKFVNQTINTNPELSRHFSGGFHPRKLKTDKNRKLIPEDLIVLSYLPADEKLYIFAATSDTVIAKVVSIGLPELSKNIKYIYNFTSKHVKGANTDALRMARGEDPEPLPADFNRNESNYKKISEQLYNWLIAPVKNEIDKKDLVAVIPTGVLHFLPFQLLGETLPNGKFDYLIEHYTLFYSHTLEMLYQHADKPDHINILAFGNADNTLPASENEVNDLKSIYPESEVLLRDQATEDRVKKYRGKHNVLHFATHGNLDYFDYNKSYLTLAPNDAIGEDGKLTIEEVWEIEDIYSYQLVTLSACSTALANDYSIGWAVSPASSFIDADTPTVVASLWSVNDASTALLMKYFYKNMQTMNKVDALRLAQIKLSNTEKYAHPYYWSPFILIGSWK